jgi:hypothetical protein
LIPSALTGLIPSNINNVLPTDILFWNGPNDTQRTTELVAATGTGAAGKATDSGNDSGRIGGLESVLAMGVAVSVVVGMLAAWL